MATKAPAYDWTEFRLGIYVRKRPDELFPFWATAAGMCRWFVRSAVFAPSDGRPDNPASKTRIPTIDTLTARSDTEACRQNDRYLWEWYYGGGISGEGWILELRAPTRLVFTFGERMEVEIALRKRGNHCEIDLRQYNIPDTPVGRHEDHMGSRLGWTFFLTNLKSVAEGGLDLRETEHAKVRQYHLINI